MLEFEPDADADVATDATPKRDQYSVIRQGRSTLYLDLDSGLNLHYTRGLVDAEDSKTIFRLLERHLTYNSAKDSKVLIFGKYVDIPRRQVAYGEPGTFYRFAGNVVEARNWYEDGIIETLLRKLRHKLEVHAGSQFNFVLINRYEDGDQYIGFHTDSEADLGPEPKIAGISFGAVRPLHFKRISTGTTDIKVDLDPGSVVIMHHPTNVYWKHSIPKTAKKIGPRISLTYRKMVNF